MGCQLIDLIGSFLIVPLGSMVFRQFLMIKDQAIMLRFFPEENFPFPPGIAKISHPL
jgi:hypothetical protein